MDLVLVRTMPKKIHGNRPHYSRIVSSLIPRSTNSDAPPVPYLFTIGFEMLQ